jgi:hypothetical protein
VGLSQVSKDWRMTFFSSAARIWSQGLITVAGEVANAIELILACVAYLLPEQFIRGFGQRLSHGEVPEWPFVLLLIADCVISACLLLILTLERG